MLHSCIQEIIFLVSFLIKDQAYSSGPNYLSEFPLSSVIALGFQWASGEGSHSPTKYTSGGSSRSPLKGSNRHPLLHVSAYFIPYPTKMWPTPYFSLQAVISYRFLCLALPFLSLINVTCRETAILSGLLTHASLKSS